MHTSSLVSPRRLRFAMFLALVAALVAPLVPIQVTPVAAQAICIVTNGNDSGPGSLRTSIGDPDCATITFAPTVSDVVLTSGQLLIQRNVAIDGGSAGVTVRRADSAGDFRIFEITSGSVVVMTDLTISGGRAERGGGIYSDGTLTITRTKVSDNAVNVSGGGIYNRANGIMNIVDSEIVDNTSVEQGAGIYANGISTTIERSTISRNETTATINAGGGGIAKGSAGVLTIADSTFSFNEANTSGGAIFIFGGNFTITGSNIFDNKALTGSGGAIRTQGNGTGEIVSSAFFGNNANESGGAIENAGGIVLTVENSTLSGNEAGSYGKALRASSDSRTTLTNSTIVDNTSLSGTLISRAAGVQVSLQASIVDGTCPGIISTLGNNLFTDTSCGMAASINNDLVVGDPQLGDLTEVALAGGGTTWVHIPEASSPAIDAITDFTGLPATDQRGVARPQPTVGNYDIGAVEVRLARLTVPGDMSEVATSAAGAEVTFDPSATSWDGAPLAVTCSPPSGYTFPIDETTTVTCTTQDDATADIATVSGSFTVTITRPAPPTMEQPDDITVTATSTAGAVVDYPLPEAEDADGVSLVVTCLPESGETFAVGDTTVTCTASDAVEQDVEREFTVTVALPDGPEMDQPDNMTVEAAGPGGAEVVFEGPQAQDALGNDLTVTCDPAPGDRFPLGTTIVTCSAEDMFGRPVERTFTVTVVDTTPPVLTLPDAITVTTPDVDGAIVTFSLRAGDVVDGELDVTCDWDSGDRFPLGKTTVTCTATDSRGHQVTGNFTVTVQPEANLAPRLGKVLNTVIPTTNPDGTVVIFAPGVYSPIDANVRVVCVPPSGSLLPIGTHTVTCTATDRFGLTDSVTFQVTVVYDDGSSPAPQPPAPPVVPEPQEPPEEPVEPEEPEVPVADPAAFDAVWARTDLPVATGDVSRTWIWGPQPFSTLQEVPTELREAYAEAPGGQRLVRYYDKARMEITDPSADPAATWYVTNGLLVVELITGMMQVGDESFIERTPADVVIAGDLDDPDSPTYADLAGLLDPVESRVGETVTERLNGQGSPAWDVTYAYFDDVTRHNIAEPFWAFMNSTGLVWVGDHLTEDLLFENPFYGTGRPVTEAYWVTVNVGGTPHDVLLQCFERRCLTYTPENPEGWQVEAGNVGLHYFIWRYGE